MNFKIGDKVLYKPTGQICIIQFIKNGKIIAKSIDYDTIKNAPLEAFEKIKENK